MSGFSYVTPEQNMFQHLLDHLAWTSEAFQAYKFKKTPLEFVWIYYHTLCYSSDLVCKL